MKRLLAVALSLLLLAPVVYAWGPFLESGQVGPGDLRITGTPDNTTYPRWDNSTGTPQWVWATPSGSGLGDVTGPSSSTDNSIALFDNTTGKLLKGSIYQLGPYNRVFNSEDVDVGFKVRHLSVFNHGGGSGGISLYENGAGAAESFTLRGPASMTDNITWFAPATAAPDNTSNFVRVSTTGVISYGAPAGSGTVTGPATATQDNVVTWGADNTSIKDGGVALSALARLAGPTFTGVPAAPTAAADTNTTQIATTAFVIGQGYAKLDSPSFTTPTLGVASATSLNTGQGAYELYAMDQNVRTTDNVAFNKVTASEFLSSALDNTRGAVVPNTADPTGANLELGKLWYNTTSSMVKVRNADNSATQEVMTSAANHTGNFYTTGTLNGGQKTVAKTDNVTLSGSEVYGTWIECGAGCVTITLPAVSANMSVCIMATDNTQKNVDVDGSDAIVYLDGTDFGNGHKATSPAASATAPNGEFICLKGSATANKWRVIGRGATAWTDGS